MSRRIALALAFAFTTVVTFAIIAVGTTTGLFAGDDGGGASAATEASPEDVAGALLYLAATSGAPEQAPADAAPNVITEYVYVDEPAPPPVVSYVRSEPPPVPPPAGQQAPAPAPAAETAAGESSQPAPQPTSPAQRSDDDGADDEHSVAYGACDDEFKSTVAEIEPAEGGSLVTWTNGEQTVVVDGTRHAGELAVGTSAKVHAKQLWAGCTAIEIEISGDEDDD